MNKELIRVRELIIKAYTKYGQLPSFLNIDSGKSVSIDELFTDTEKSLQELVKIKEFNNDIEWLIAEYDYSTSKHRKLINFLRALYKIISGGVYDE